MKIVKKIGMWLLGVSTALVFMTFALPATIMLTICVGVGEFISVHTGGLAPKI